MSIPTSERRPWTDQEDRNLREFVSAFQLKHNSLPKWTAAASYINETSCADPLFFRNAKQCRERWINILQPELKIRMPWTEEQSLLLLNLYKTEGHRWLKISNQLPGRSENQVKNFFYSGVRRIIRKLNKFIVEHNKNAKLQAKDKKSNQSTLIKIKKVVKPTSQNQLQSQQKSMVQISRLDVSLDPKSREQQQLIFNLEADRSILESQEQKFSSIKLRSVSQQAINKLLVLAEEKQQCKLEIKEDLELQRIIETRDQFIDYIIYAIQVQHSSTMTPDSQYNQKSCHSQIEKQKYIQQQQYQKKQSQQQQKSSEPFPRIQQFLQSLNKISRSCKKKNYRMHRLGVLTPKQELQILKQKKRTQHRTDRMLRQKLREKGIDVKVIPKKQTKQQFIKILIVQGDQKCEAGEHKAKSQLPNNLKMKFAQQDQKRVIIGQSDERVEYQEKSEFNNLNPQINPLDLFSKKMSKLSFKEKQEHSSSKILIANPSSKQHKKYRFQDLSSQYSKISQSGPKTITKKNHSKKRQKKKSGDNFQVQKQSSSFQKSKPIFKQYKTRMKSANKKAQQRKDIAKTENIDVMENIGGLNIKKEQIFSLKLDSSLHSSFKSYKAEKKGQSPVFVQSSSFLSAIPTIKIHKQQGKSRMQEQELIPAIVPNFQTMNNKPFQASHGSGLINSNCEILEFQNKDTQKDKILHLSGGLMNQSHNSYQGSVLFDGPRQPHQSFNFSFSNIIDQGNTKPNFSKQENKGVEDFNRSFNLQANIANKRFFSPAGNDAFNIGFDPFANFPLTESRGYIDMQKLDPQNLKALPQQPELIESQNLIQGYPSHFSSSGHYQNPYPMNLINSVPINFIQSMPYSIDHDLMRRSLNDSMFYRQNVSNFRNASNHSSSMVRDHSNVSQNQRRDILYHSYSYQSPNQPWNIEKPDHQLRPRHYHKTSQQEQNNGNLNELCRKCGSSIVSSLLSNRSEAKSEDNFYNPLLEKQLIKQEAKQSQDPKHN